MGAEVLWLPTIGIEAPLDSAPLRAAAAVASSYDWIVFTSANAVRRFFAARGEDVPDAAPLEGVRICAVGPATARAVEQEGAHVHVVPAEFVGEGVVSALVAHGLVEGDRVLFPRAERTRAVVPTSLREIGAEVTEVVAYRTVPEASKAAKLRRLLDRGEVDFLTFTSSSAVQSFTRMVGVEVGRAKVASIGPITSATARASGLTVDIEADPYTSSGLAAAIARYFSAAEDA
jgi:uroporphyrinogen III methyltransferase/synthase